MLMNCSAGHGAVSLFLGIHDDPGSGGLCQRSCRRRTCDAGGIRPVVVRHAVHTVAHSDVGLQLSLPLLRRSLPHPARSIAGYDIQVSFLISKLFTLILLFCCENFKSFEIIFICLFLSVCAVML